MDGAGVVAGTGAVDGAGAGAGAVVGGASEAPSLSLPVRPGVGRFLVLLAVFVCAACGLVYELELVALASYLLGDSVTQASLVLSVMVFAMGIGSLLAKRLCARAAAAFGVIEAGLALVGGCSALALYGAFAWSGRFPGAWASGASALLLGFTFVIGVLIGGEVPLLMEMIQRIRRQEAGGAVADLFAADYVGALVGGLAFPFLLLPFLGQLTGALLTGAINACAGAALVLGLFHRGLSRRARWTLLVLNAFVLGLLAMAATHVADFERAARRAVFGDDVRVALHSDVQDIVLTGRPGQPLTLHLGYGQRVSSADEGAYHQALVRPALAGPAPHRRVLVLGGGDGLAVREVLRVPGVRAVDVVEVDRALLRLARGDPQLAGLNRHAFDDPRVHAVSADAFTWLRANRRRFDVVVADLPDPRQTAATKLYSQEFYGLLKRALAPGGRAAVHVGSPGNDARDYWRAERTLRAAGLRTAPYAARKGRTEWGFLLAAGERPRLTVAARPRGGFGAEELREGARRVAETRVRGLEPSTLVSPRYGL
ncbi:polyamine aminopropyltransferase [Streptomyces sp. CA-253872]|uniref:polyamine aminopropyltransferase n=1 Tax=Streptomyces sp. CA-253872 TaxID=3240067 RepID=UPI003D923D7D